MTVRVGAIPVVVTGTPDDKENEMPYVAEPKPPSAGWDYPSLEHLDGVPWMEAPIPRRWHRCWAQTKGLVGFDEVERCACGAIRNTRFRGWMERNSSRKSPRQPVPDTPYIERKQAEIDQLAEFAAYLADRSSSGE
jgi:hypothetical protein